MAYPEEYRELIDNADSAIRALLAESREEAFIGLRTGLGELWQAVADEEARDEARDRLERLRESRERLERLRESREHAPGDYSPTWDAAPDAELQSRREHLACKRAWRDMSLEVRERLLLEALGDDELALSELAERMTARLGWREFSLFDRGIRSLAMKMLHAGQLERVPETHRGNARYRWHCKRELGGAIADLERAYHDGREVA